MMNKTEGRLHDSRWARLSLAVGPALEARVGAFARYLGDAHGCNTVLRTAADPFTHEWEYECSSGACGDPGLRRIARDLDNAIYYAHISSPHLAHGSQAIERLCDATANARLGILVCRTTSQELDATLEELRASIEHVNQRLLFAGTTECRLEGSVAAIALISAQELAPGERAPDTFRVLAIVPTYNEEDIIEQTLRYLTEQGIDVYLLDNWSTDRTIERAQRYLGRGLLRIERFPHEGASGTYDLANIMRRVEQISAEHSDATWCMLHDADERRCSPWPHLDLRDALWHVERCGYSCIDHVTLNFWPTDDSFCESSDPEPHFRFFEFSDHPGHFHQRRAWKSGGNRVSLAPSAGHDAFFSDRRVYPYKFLLKHYPIRSRAHGERKVRADRQQRWNEEERALGWHQQYEGIAAESYVRDARTLTLFDPAAFNVAYLIERLSGVGIFDRPPPWASAPCW